MTSPLPPELAAASADVLVARLTLGIDPFETRLAMAERLGALGDPRLPPIGPPSFIEVPEGPFLLGTDEQASGEREHKAHESPRVTLDLPTFEIDRFLVTVARFTEFIDDGGYRRRELWRPIGWTFRWTCWSACATNPRWWAGTVSASSSRLTRSAARR